MSNFYSTSNTTGSGGQQSYYSGQGYSHQQPPQQQQQQFSSSFPASNTAGIGAQESQQQWPSQPTQPQYSMNQKQPFGSSQSFGSQSQQSQQQPFWNPATQAMAAAALNDGMSGDAMMNIAAGVGQSFIQNSTARMIPGLETTMILLRSYFAVDNRYVLAKMQKILLPFLSKQWNRQRKDAGAPGMEPQYDLPTLDENAPDLYIPSMSLISYVLLCALVEGTAGQFNPEVIPDVLTWCFVTQILEVLAIRVGFYMMQTPVPLLDLFSYTGYKYLGLCINMLVGIGLSQFGLSTYYSYWPAFLWTASACSFFMLKTMANNVPTQTASTGPKRELVVLVFAALQFVTMWFLSQTKFL